MQFRYNIWNGDLQSKLFLLWLSQYSQPKYNIGLSPSLHCQLRSIQTLPFNSQVQMGSLSICTSSSIIMILLSFFPTVSLPIPKFCKCYDISKHSWDDTKNLLFIKNFPHHFLLRRMSSLQNCRLCSIWKVFCFLEKLKTNQKHKKITVANLLFFNKCLISTAPKTIFSEKNRSN